MSHWQLKINLINFWPSFKILIYITYGWNYYQDSKTFQKIAEVDFNCCCRTYPLCLHILYTQLQCMHACMHAHVSARTRTHVHTCMHAYHTVPFGDGMPFVSVVDHISIVGWPLSVPSQRTAFGVTPIPNTNAKTSTTEKWAHTCAHAHTHAHAFSWAEMWRAQDSLSLLRI